MLKQRVLTALVLIPLTVWAIFGLDTPFLSIILAVLVLAGAWEWTRLVPLTTRFAEVVFLALLASGLLAVWLLLTVRGTVLPVLLIALLWWIGAVIWITCYRGKQNERNAHWIVTYLAGFLTLTPAWIALVALHSLPNGSWLLLYVLVLMWVADSGAYFAGRLWGKTKLAPHVSPGKTWEGVGGGVAFTAIYAAVSGYLFGFMNYLLGLFVIVSMTAVAFSIVGDLLESLLKREQGLKDSGTLLPGHGGVLDRVDSVTAGAPVFLLGFSLLEWVA